MKAKKIMIGLTILSILMLSGCVNDTSEFCKQQGYNRYAHLTCQDFLCTEFICINDTNNFTTSRLYNLQNIECNDCGCKEIENECNCKTEGVVKDE